MRHEIVLVEAAELAVNLWELALKVRSSSRLIGASQHLFSQLRKHFPYSHAALGRGHLRIEAKTRVGRAID